MTIHLGSLPDLPAHVRTVVLIGGRSSDHLKEIARRLEFRGCAAFRIEAAGDLQPRWFVDVEEVGVLVGAEDLESEVRTVIDRLHQFAAAAARGMLEGVAR